MAFNKAKKDIKSIEFLFMKYENMIHINHPSTTSIADFRPTLEMYLNDYNLNKK